MSYAMHNRCDGRVDLLANELLGECTVVWFCTSKFVFAECEKA
jgi:hypothetical protein